MVLTIHNLYKNIIKWSTYSRAQPNQRNKKRRYWKGAQWTFFTWLFNGLWICEILMWSASSQWHFKYSRLFWYGSLSIRLFFNYRYDYFSCECYIYTGMHIYCNARYCFWLKYEINHKNWEFLLHNSIIVP